MCLNYYSSIAPFLFALLLLLLQLQLLLLTVVVMMVMVNVLVVVLFLLEFVEACAMALPSMIEASTSTRTCIKLCESASPGQYEDSFRELQLR